MTDKEMIEVYAADSMLSIERMYEDEDNGLTAELKHRWRATLDDEDRGIYSGDEGILTLCVVGAEQYHNRRVSMSFMADGMDCGMEVVNIDILEPIDD